MCFNCHVDRFSEGLFSGRHFQFLGLSCVRVLSAFVGFNLKRCNWFLCLMLGVVDRETSSKMFVYL